MSQTKENIIDVVLWGDSQAGKTTALAAYLCDIMPDRKPQWLDRSAPETQRTLDILGDTWNVLLQNRLPVATMSHKYYEVRAKNQSLVRFRDMRGGNARNLSQDDKEALRTASAALLFVEWPNAKTMFDKISVGNAFRAKGEDCQTALVITKVEWFLSPLKLQKFIVSPRLAAQDMELSSDFRDILNLFDDKNIFPITVYGYAKNDYPAHYRDEFGRLVPWGIKPLNVASPFDRILYPLLSLSQSRGNL